MAQPRNPHIVDEQQRIKLCSMCKEWKPFEAYVSDPRKRLGITSNCRSCRATKARISRKEHPERHIKYRWSNEQFRDYYARNIDRCRAYAKKYREKNRDKAARRFRERRQNDVAFRILDNLRGRLNDAVRRHKTVKAFHTRDLFGCSIIELRAHLESQFTDDMSWDNYGGRRLDSWEIDHIRPCNEFDLTDPDQQKQCFHYSNLQPLWKRDNLAKAKGPYGPRAKAA